MLQKWSVKFHYFDEYETYFEISRNVENNIVYTSHNVAGNQTFRVSHLLDEGSGYYVRLLTTDPSGNTYYTHNM